MPDSGRGRGRKIWFLVAVGLAFYAVIRGLDLVSDALFYPWALAEPPLTGTWVGQLTTGSGRPRGVLVDMHRRRSRGRSACAKCGQLQGTGLTCDERGREWRYLLSGTSEDRHATRLGIDARPAVDPPPDGLELGSMRGRWDGGDALDLEAEFHWRRGDTASSSTADPDTRGFVPLPMRRGTEADFRALCGRLRAG